MGKFGTLSCPPTPPSPAPRPPLLSLSQALVVLIMYCFYRRHDADVENMWFIYFMQTSTLNCCWTSGGVGEVRQSTLTCICTFLIVILCIEVISLRWDVVSQREEVARKERDWEWWRGSSLMPWTYLCLIDILPALCNNIFEFCHISSSSDSVRSVQTRKMKENHRSENEPQTTWLNV